MSDEQGFLSRWARRKHEAAVQPVPEPEPAPVPAPVEDDRPDNEILTELGLPDPLTLKPGDDIKGFMQDAVPARLRRLALRQLWRSNPVLANLDELLEYGEDYTDAATVVENLQTAYQVGRGFWTEEDEAKEAAKEAAAEAAASAKTPVDDAETAGEDPADLSPDETGGGSDLAGGNAKKPTESFGYTERLDPSENADESPDEPAVSATRKRMTFHYTN